ncbi:MAG: c-type cytochrome [Caldilineaceae bacterium]|nr:c-type cytochrome [Caldilineaceae bacterium]
MDRFTYWLERSSLYIALTAAWIAMCGSLYFSEVAGYIPCTFCWYQRILMYPLAVIIAVGLWRQDQQLPFFVLPLSVVGIGVSTYHYLLQKTTLFSELSTCQVGVPCSGIWINWLGFITIPFLALIAFFVITVMSFIAWQAGEPATIEDGEHEDGLDSAIDLIALRPWLPVVAIIVVVVIVFVVLGQMGSTAADAHASADFPVLESGAQTMVDGTTNSETALAEGRRLYSEACAACHGPNGEGVTGLGAALTTSALLQQSTERELLTTIRSGLAANDPHNESGIAMPGSGGRPDLSDEELTLIIRYLRAGM